LSGAAELLTRLRAMGVHLSLEDETIRLNAPKGALTPALQAELKASKTEILESLRSAQRSSFKGTSGPIPRVARQKLMPLSFAQQRLWFLQQMDPESAAYNLESAFCMKGNLDPDALDRSLHSIILRHEDLRTIFVQHDGTPYTKIADGSGWKMDRLSLDRYPGESLEQAVTRFNDETTRRPFNLEQAPLLRAYFLRSGEQEAVLVLSMHHIISDGWSMGVLIRELAENYRALLLGESPSITDLPIQYIDYSVWQREWLASGVLDRQAQYWRKQLEAAPPVVRFPPDRERSSAADPRGRRSKLVLPAGFVERLHAFGRAHDTTLFMTLLSVFMLLLSRYSGLQDVVVGSPSANRNRAELSELIGFFINNLVLRVKVEDNITFLELLRWVREATLGAYENQDLPFDYLVREIRTDRNPEHTPFFQTMFILQNFPLDELKLPELTVTPLEIDPSTGRFDLTVEVYPYRKELVVYFDYRIDLYHDATIGELQKNFKHMLESVIDNPGVLLEYVPLWPESEREELLNFGNPPTVAMPAGALLLDALTTVVKETPDRIAVRAGTESLTYAELDDRAERLSVRLQQAGASRGSLIPVCLNRSTELLVALLAVLKAGAAYVPLDPASPKHRIRAILDDILPSVLISESSLFPLLEPYRSQCLALGGSALVGCEETPVEPRTPHAEVPAPADLAYVIFTSGSTGNPKGVEITHGALANFLKSMSKEPGFTSQNRILAVTTVSFDIAGLELFLPLYVGGETIIALEPGDLPTLLDDLARVRPTVMQATPAMWQMLISAGWEGDAALTAFCGGEALTPTLAAALLPRVKALWNMYGPTETTIWSSVYRVPSAVGTSIPLGGPIQNTRFYVLDAGMEPVPFGVTGELYIGGIGLARGYFRRPELTAESFTIAPFGETDRLYRTGDLVRRRRDGTIEFLGRADFQVKVRGFRIELGEIEHALRQQPEIAECVMLLREDAGQKELVAYLVFYPGQTVSLASLRRRLRERIPDYMIPAKTVTLPALPRLPNGKLDRSKLPSPDQAQNPVDRSAYGFIHNLPAHPTESAIARVFQDLLHTDRVGIDQSFFDLGAHSLLLVKAHERLRQELAPNLRLVSFFQYPTIAELAAHIDQCRVAAGEIGNAGHDTETG
jgi:amino acid adenylation domain-containing protein